MHIFINNHVEIAINFKYIVIKYICTLYGKISKLVYNMYIRWMKSLSQHVEQYKINYLISVIKTCTSSIKGIIIFTWMEVKHKVPNLEVFKI